MYSFGRKAPGKLVSDLVNRHAECFGVNIIPLHSEAKLKSLGLLYLDITRHFILNLSFIEMNTDPCAERKCVKLYSITLFCFNRIH